MSGRTRQLAFVGAASLVVAAALLSCSSKDTDPPNVVGGPGGLSGGTPLITQVVPGATCASADSVISIFGQNFTVNPIPTVTVNGVAAEVDSVSSNLIIVRTNLDPSVIPATGTFVTVTVTTEFGTARLDDAIRVFPPCSAIPALVSVSPSTGAREGGDLVSIFGSGLACANTVTWVGSGGTILAAEIVSVLSNSEIVVASPPNPSTQTETFSIFVNAVGCGTGSLANAWIYSGGADGVPDAQLLSPNNGPTTGGNEVIVSGLNLDLVESIAVGPSTVPASDWVLEANGNIRILSMPASPGGTTSTLIVSVIVSGNGGTDTTPVAYQYNGDGLPPACGSINPTQGSVSGGETVTIVGAAGTNLSGVDGVLFGGRSATQVAHPTDNSLIVTTPAYIATGFVTVQLTVGGSIVSDCPLPFEFTEDDACTEPPQNAAVTSPSPVEGGPGTRVTIVGENLIDDTGTPATVRFGAFPATLVTSAEDVPAAGRDTLVVTAPDGGFDTDTAVTVTLSLGGCPTLTLVQQFTYTEDDPCADPPSAVDITDPVDGSGASEGPIGEQVTVAGQNLVLAGTPGVVRFGAFTATTVAFAEDVPQAGGGTADEIVVTAPDPGVSIPAQGLTVPVTVTTCATVASATSFTYVDVVVGCQLDAPEASLVGTMSGTAGTELRIEGQELIEDDGTEPTVRFAVTATGRIIEATISQALRDFPTAGNDVLLLTAPSGHDIGDVAGVTVETCAGIADAGDFTYACTAPEVNAQDAPEGAGLSPTSGPAGTRITIRGTDLFGGDGQVAQVFFGAFQVGLVASFDSGVAGGDLLVLDAPDVGFGDGEVVTITVRTCGGDVTTNADAVALTFTFTAPEDCPNAPSITSVDPDTGPPGTTVTVTGDNLIGDNGANGRVFFGAFEVSINTVIPGVGSDPDVFILTAPSFFDSGDDVALKVVTCGGEDEDTFSYFCNLPEINVAGLSPDSGTPGTRVTVRGAYLVGDDGQPADVFFDAFSATIVASLDAPADGDDTLVFDAPDIGVEGDVTVQLVTCGGTVERTFEYTAAGGGACDGGTPPSVAVSGVEPTSGPVGQLVTITGTNFIDVEGDPATVTFGTSDATVIDVTSTLLRVRAPAGFNDGETVTITITNCAGSASRDGDGTTLTFTYEEAFSVDSISPTSGPRNGDQAFRIFGSGFDFDLDGDGTDDADTVRVLICDVPAIGADSGSPQDPAIESRSEISGLTGLYLGPAPIQCDVVVQLVDCAGAGDCAESRTNGTVLAIDTLPGAYRYLPKVPDGIVFQDDGDLGAPTGSVSADGPPVTSPEAGGLVFVIYGTDMLDATDVQFGGNVNDPLACQLQTLNDSNVSGIVPFYRPGVTTSFVEVEVFVESPAGRDQTTVTLPDGSGNSSTDLFRYYPNPELASAGATGETDFDSDGTLCSSGCARPGSTVHVTGTNFKPSSWSHIGSVEIDDINQGGSGLSGEVAIFNVTDDGFDFILPSGAEAGDVFSITLRTPNGQAACVAEATSTLIGVLSLSEVDCDDETDGDGDGLVDCSDADCSGQTGPDPDDDGPLEAPICEATEQTCNDGLDQDGDGDIDCADEDCDGRNGDGGLCQFGAESTCSDGFDNDADGGTDCLDPNLDCEGEVCAAGMECSGVDCVTPP